MPSKLSQAKTIGGVGSILMVLSIIPQVGFIVGIVGLILVLIAVRYISDSVGDPAIFSNMLYSVIAGVVGFAAATAMAITTAATLLVSMPVPGPQFVMSILGLVIAFLAVIWVALVISAIFLRRSFNAIASSLGVGMFSTAALLYLIGAALTIVFVGFIVLLIAEILMVVAFFSIPEEKAVTGSGAQQVTSQP